MIALLEHHQPARMTDLEKFLEDVIRTSSKGLRLHEFVLKALHHGYRGEERGELTKNIHRSLKRLVRRGVIRRTEDENAVEFVA
jgi:hypothetical protein